MRLTREQTAVILTRRLKIRDVNPTVSVLPAPGPHALPIERATKPAVPVLPAPGPHALPIERAFLTFHAENPHVYTTLVRLAREWISAHGYVPASSAPGAAAGNRLGVKMLFERARWDLALETAGSGGFSLNNNFTAYYARMMMAHEPDLVGVFETRTQTSCAS